MDGKKYIFFIHKSNLHGQISLTVSVEGFIFFFSPRRYELISSFLGLPRRIFYSTTINYHDFRKILPVKYTCLHALTLFLYLLSDVLQKNMCRTTLGNRNNKKITMPRNNVCFVNVCETLVNTSDFLSWTCIKNGISKRE